MDSRAGMKNPEIIPLDHLSFWIQKWQNLAACMICGAVIGWLLSFITPPVYEARSSYSMSIDYVQTGELTDIEEDQAIMAVGDILLSDSVIQQILSQVESKVPEDDLKRMMDIERRNQMWVMRVLDEDAGLALEILQAWNSSTFLALEEAHSHSMKAAAISRYLQSLSDCLTQTAIVEPVSGACQEKSIDDLQKEIQETGIALDVEQDKSLGVLSAMTISRNELPALTPGPIQQNTGRLVLSGAFLGLVICAFWLEIRNGSKRDAG